jgi:hypothetical protein
LGLERLDDRIVPATQTFSGVGANAATALAAFEAAIGGANNGGGGGPQATGFRTINWDGVGLGATDGAFTNQVITPNHTVGIPVDRFEARGTIFEEIYAVTDTSFTTENPGLQPPVQFPPFSGNKIFAMFNDNTIGLSFVLPGSTTPAAVRGFGAIFLDVEKANTSKIEFSSGSSDLGDFFVPAGASGQAEFLGVLFDTPVVTSAELTVGDGTLFSVHGGTVTSGPPDLSIGGTVDQAATDDFAFSEPVAVATAALGPDVVASGQPNGSAQVFTPAADGQFNPTPAATLTPFAGFTGNVRTASADVNGDGIADTILVTGPGTPIKFAVISGKDNTTVLIPPTSPFAGSESFTGGGFVTAGDLDGDGRAEIAISPDQGGGPRVTIFSLVGTTPTVKANFLGITGDPNFRGGARTALGDVNKDGTPDLAVAAGFLGGPRVALFDGKTVLTTQTKLVNDFFAFPGTDATTLRNGSFVAIGDVSGDGFGDLIFGGGPGGAPRVFILSGALVSANNVDGAENAPVANFFVAGNSSDRGGVRVAATDADLDSKADVVVGSGEGSAAKVRVYLGKNFTTAAEPGTFQDLSVFGGGSLPGGVFVG